MKSFKSITFLGSILVSLVVMSSCQKNESGSSQPAHINNTCINNPSLCQPNIYQQGSGFYPYGYGGYGSGYPYGVNSFHYMNNSAYLCSCPAGTVPTYNNYGGLGCVNAGYTYGGGAYAYFGWGTSGATNNQWVNIPQISNHTGYNQSNCYNGVVQSCFVDQPSTCSAGFTCQATSAQTRLGLCVSNNAINTGGGPR